MRGTDAVMIFLTFLTGLFLGAYLYITVFAPTYEQDDTGVTDTRTIGFLLQGEAFGGCQMIENTCPSFALRHTRGFTFTDPVAGDVSGYLSGSQFTELKRVIAETEPLQRFTADDPAARCRSASDGIDYRYRLILDGDAYEFSTCGTTFTDTALAREFAALWPEMANTTGPADNLLDIKLGDVLEQKIDSWFQYDDR